MTKEPAGREDDDDKDVVAMFSDPDLMHPFHEHPGSPDQSPPSPANPFPAPDAGDDPGDDLIGPEP